MSEPHPPGFEPSTPPARRRDASDTTDVTSDVYRRFWLAALLIGLIGYGAVQLYLATLALKMVLTPAGQLVSVLLVVPAWTLIGLAYRAMTSRFMPIASALLALIPAVLYWGFLLGFLPFAYLLMSNQLGAILIGAAMGTLSLLALPGHRSKIVGAVGTLLIGIAAVVLIAVMSADAR